MKMQFWGRSVLGLAFWPTSQPANQPASQPPTSQPTSQPTANQPTNQPANPPTHPAHQPTHQVRGVFLTVRKCPKPGVAHANSRRLKSIVFFRVFCVCSKHRKNAFEPRRSGLFGRLAAEACHRPNRRGPFCMHFYLQSGNPPYRIYAFLPALWPSAV